MNTAKWCEHHGAFVDTPEQAQEHANCTIEYVDFCDVPGCKNSDRAVDDMGVVLCAEHANLPEYDRLIRARYKKIDDEYYTEHPDLRRG